MRVRRRPAVQPPTRGRARDGHRPPHLGCRDNRRARAAAGDRTARGGGGGVAGGVGLPAGWGCGRGGVARRGGLPAGWGCGRVRARRAPARGLPRGGLARGGLPRGGIARAASLSRQSIAPGLPRGRQGSHSDPYPPGACAMVSEWRERVALHPGGALSLRARATFSPTIRSATGARRGRGAFRHLNATQQGQAGRSAGKWRSGSRRASARPRGRRQPGRRAPKRSGGRRASARLRGRRQPGRQAPEALGRPGTSHPRPGRTAATRASTPSSRARTGT
jgi:hypothetical protein